MNTPRTALEECTKLVDHIESLIHPFLDTGDSRTAADFAVGIAMDTCDLRQALSEALGGWLPIETLVCDDSDVLVWFDNDRTGHFGPQVINADHDSDSHYWKEVGATHWRAITQPTSAKGSGE